MPIEEAAHREDADIGLKVLDEETIQKRVGELGSEIGEYYQTGDLLLIALLKGSFMFLADLVRRIPRPHKVDFMVASSYGSGTESSGAVRLLYDPDVNVAGQHVLLVEDIVDTGHTLKRVVQTMRDRGPESVEVVTLLHKRISSASGFEPRFVGFDVPQEFLVGYGLDYDDRYRHLPYVASLKGQDG